MTTTDPTPAAIAREVLEKAGGRDAAGDLPSREVILARRMLEAEGLLAEVACCGVEHEDPRISYVTVQIDRPLWDELSRLRAAGEAP